MSFIKAIRKDKEGISIKRLLHERLAGSEPERTHKKVHASDLTKDKEFCPREFALLDLTKKIRRAVFLNTSMRTTFEEGRAIQKLIRERWLGDLAVGDWKCRSCGAEKHYCKRPQGHCGKSSIKCAWVYREIVFQSKENVWGGVDLFLDVGEPKLLSVEIKTIDKDYFKALRAAMAEHKWRTNLYMRIIETSKVHVDFAKRINTRVAHIIYKARAFGMKDPEPAAWGVRGDWFSPWKEFRVARNDSETNTIIGKARCLDEFRKPKKPNNNEYGLTPCGICPTGMGKRAQQCSMVKECFSGGFPGESTWMTVKGPAHSGKKVVK